MTTISSRKKRCNMCKSAQLNYHFLEVLPEVHICDNCKDEFIAKWNEWKANKDAEVEVERTIEVSSNKPYVNCTVCGALIMPCIMGFSEQLRDTKICVDCMEKRIMKAIEGM